MTAAHMMIPPLRAAASILIATPNMVLRRRLGESLRKLTTLQEAATGAEALSMMERHCARIVILDRLLPDLNSDELIGVIERQFPYTSVLLLDGESGRIDVPEEMRGQEAYRWFQELNNSLPQSAPPAPVHSPAEGAATDLKPLPGMIGVSPAMLQLASLVRAVAPHSTAVLITGETGAGKELVAEAVHRLSHRAEKPFITVNCAAIPEALVEAELFGHTRGAFTGAVQSRLGKIHAAQGGTIFFDEIGELPLASQAKLLRFLESGEVQRLGTSDVFRLDARVVAATNVDLEERVQQKLFREDLYYRLSVFPIELPPLRQRCTDITLLAHHFIAQLAGNKGHRLSPETEAILASHSWPGNVRELRNVMERAFVLSAGRPVITPEQIRLRKSCASERSPSETS
ncbi:MAG: sigma-54 dependent transcriptional regulator [Candidatus Korobacteraceae bacterium]